MVKKVLTVSTVLAILLASLPTAAVAERPTAMRIPDVQPAQPPDFRDAKAACTMTEFIGPETWVPYCNSGDWLVQYFDPVEQCTAPIYPFEITALEFTLYDVAEEPFPVPLDVVVYDLAPSGLLCDGPGPELCRVSAVADQATFEYPNLGTVTFPTPCCVNRPFFIGIEFTGTGSGMYPAPITDEDLAMDTCEQWFYVSGTSSLEEWYERFGGSTGYLWWYVHGETNSPNCAAVCDWNPGDPVKMHFPQYPDETGWDVNATAPVVLAEDWTCTETGWIKDFHLWGSWKHDIEGQILYFILSIHRDIPADQNPDGYSKPGEQLWMYEVADFELVPIDPPALEGWYDPSTGEVIYDDHGSYFQYNICLDEWAWFWQEQDSIYWLNVSAVVLDPGQTQWGWKS
ncbi:MAG: hypothetical protein JSV44_06620, partial [Candidatus Zixiibacteriota bacterium]